MKPVSTKSAHFPFLLRIYSIEAVGSVAANLIMFGIFFFMQRRFGWGARRNLILSCAQGIVYVVGSLAASPLAHHFERQKFLRVVELALLAISVTAACFHSQVVIVVLLLAYAMIHALQWPVVESLCAVGADAHQLSRRISIYNLVWSGTAAATIAACGLIIARSQYGIFWVAAAMHLVALILLLRVRPIADTGHAQIAPEPELLRARELAKRLSRIALPATYAVIYATGAIMPSLSVIQSASPETRTALASVWMIARWLSFVALGATVWWHTRPRALLIAAFVLLLAFLGVTLIPQTLYMVLAQIALGVAMGLIYSASLYFGTVLSDGSTAQNSYHEALIGVGSILGPGCGALAGTLQPDNPSASVYAVGAILFISVLGACVVSLRYSVSGHARIPE